MKTLFIGVLLLMFANQGLAGQCEDWNRVKDAINTNKIACVEKESDILSWMYQAANETDGVKIDILKEQLCLVPHPYSVSVTVTGGQIMHYTPYGTIWEKVKQRAECLYK